MMIAPVHAIDQMLIPVNMKMKMKKVKNVKMKKVKMVKMVKKHHDPMIPTMIVYLMMQTRMHSSILPSLIDVLHLVMSVRFTKTIMSLMSFV
jgi:hypothetical protein